MDRWHRTGLVCGMLVLGAACAGGHKDAGADVAARDSAGTNSEGTLEDPTVRAKLRALALQASSVAGVTSPRTMLAAAFADHQAAVDLISGDIVNDHAPVYVVVMTGGPFTTTNAWSPPPGVPPPQGNVFTLTVDAQTYRVTDVSYTDDAPDLTRFDSEVVDLLAD